MKIFILMIICTPITLLAKSKFPESEALYNGLKKSGIPASKKGYYKPYVAYDVSCSIQFLPGKTKDGITNTETTCELYDKPRRFKGAKKYSFKGTIAEKMRSALHSQKVYQGDSGAFTPYLDCSYTPDSKLRPYRCFVAEAVECDRMISCNF